MSCTIALPANKIIEMNRSACLPREHRLSAAAAAKPYYNAAPAPAPASPPAYSPPAPALAALDEIPTKLPPARFKVTPREEEGHEPLPEYSTSVFKTALFDFKTEMDTPFTRSHDRSWLDAYVILNGTAFELYKPKRRAFMGNTFIPGESADSTVGYEPGHVIAKYTLQGAEVGVAADYIKRHFVIRMRLEKVQILLSMRSLARMLEWVEAISAAIDIAPSLEDRSLPRYQTIPRRRRRTPEQMVREQEEIIRRHFPQLLEGAERQNREEERQHEDDIDVDAFRAIQPASAPASVRNLDARIPEQPRHSSASLSAPSSHEMTRCHSAAASVSSTSSTESDAKWSPPPTLTAHGNLMFARRCLAILPADAPRRSEYIVSEGKRWKLDWEAKCLMEIQEGELLPPPEYSEEYQDEGLV